MRFLKTALLSLSIVALGATSASAFEFFHSVRGGLLPSYTTGDTVTVDVFMDADPLLVILSIAVNVPADSLAYDPVASTALPVIYPAPPPIYNTTGNHPGYVLYTAGKPSTIIEPLLDPRDLPFGTWPNPAPGQQQVNVNYFEPSFTPAAASGTNIWIASIVYDVVGGAGSTADVGLSLSSGGNVLNVNNVELDPSTVPVTAPIGVNIVPEPASLGLGAAALAMTAWLARRRRRA